jgi:purine-binding chemotaxis protein CheW
MNDNKSVGNQSDEQEYVTVIIGEQLFGITIDRVHDVFIASSITRVPLAPQEIRGLLNLRGRVVTAMCMRARLGLPVRNNEADDMAVGLEHNGESYGLLVDQVGEVLKLSTSALEPNPVHLDPRWAALSRGVHRLNGKLLIIFDVDAVLAYEPVAKAA